MENPPASIPASSDDPSLLTPQPERPEQGKFNQEETDFLKTYIPAYQALCEELSIHATGPKGTGSVKGQKKNWILSKVFQEYVKHFSSEQNGGPQLDSLRAKILRWFANRSPQRNSASTASANTVTTSKRPRATNGANVFAEEQKMKIKARMAEQRGQEGGLPKQFNLNQYHTIKHELFEQLTNEERLAYEAKAAKKNIALKGLPQTSEIFKNQQDIVGAVARVLNDLIGWDWGQYGEAVFFVQGAFRNVENDLKTFNVSIGPNAKTSNFSLMLPEYKTVLRAPFHGWAEEALPIHSQDTEGSTTIVGEQKYVIDVQENGLPRLPCFDINQVAPNDARSMLKSYIELTWKFTIQQACVQDSVAVPWDRLDTVELRRKLLVKAESFSHVKTLDPMRMSPHDVYDVLELLSQGQNSGVRALEFSVGDNFNYDELGNDEISELPDLPTPPLNRRLGAESALRDVGIKAIGDLDNGISELPDASIQFPSKAFTTSSPVVDPPPKSLPFLSESTIKLAIENVAKAGHLMINSEAIAINVVGTSGQTLDSSKQGGKAKTHLNTSKSKKRTREGGPTEDMLRTQRTKVDVPLREQSSRLKDANYKNKHVTVRAR